MTLVYFVLAGIWMMSFPKTSLPMQSSGAPVTETSTIYCQALMTPGATEVCGAKSSSPRHVEAHSRSHLVTNRSYTASKLTSDYVSAMPEPSEMLIGTGSLAKSELEGHSRRVIGHSTTLQSKDVPTVDTTSNTAEYVQFIRPNPSSACTSEMVKHDESTGLYRNQQCSHVATSANNDDVLYCEIKDDTVLSASAHEDVVAERDKLLQRVSWLTIEKQEMVYKLRDFVETNAQLHAELERSRAVIVELQNQVREIQSTLESERREKALINSRLTELTRWRTSQSNEHNVNQKQSPNNSWQRTLDGEVVKTGNAYFHIFACNTLWGKKHHFIFAITLSKRFTVK